MSNKCPSCNAEHIEAHWSLLGGVAEAIAGVTGAKEQPEAAGSGGVVAGQEGSAIATRVSHSISPFAANNLNRFCNDLELSSAEFVDCLLAGIDPSTARSAVYIGRLMLDSPATKALGYPVGKLCNRALAVWLART